MGTQDIKDDSALQHLVRELEKLRRHNKTFKPGDPQDDLFLFAEAALTLVVLERFLRLLLGNLAAETHTLPNLLEIAVSKKLIELRHDKGPQVATKQLKDVRNTILHGNFEQAAKQAGRASVAEYFRTDFASEIEKVYWITVDLVGQVLGPPTASPA